ncbi:dihydroorotate dehydrogenase electron transfer subunit [Thermococcus sp.]|uniref:dihydroorotate dehydrogenase electron transfer subunit n=1 Tax=Thermococcus sp. TaxID=35749 RepID=UPI00263272EC|nr:dihydroorotate dehydrogenase electron transfer subunit [Thermococcus sp.]
MLRAVDIRETFDVADNVRVFRLAERLDFTPGQFLMLWIPGVGEKPFSLAGEDALMVKRRGPFTSRLFELGEGDRVWIRGPYGKGFRAKGKRVALVAGGIGIPPLRALARLWGRKFEEVTLIYGARRREELALWDIGDYVGEVILTTEDGSAGRMGYPTDVLRETAADFDQVYTCGPEGMIIEVLKIMRYRNVQASMERYMKCGIGICGSCALGRYLVCRDGPVFDGRTLEEVYKPNV